MSDNPEQKSEKEELFDIDNAVTSPGELHRQQKPPSGDEVGAGAFDSEIALIINKDAGLVEELAPSASLSPGTLFANRYRILNEIGAGGMGVVYRVEDSLDGSMVALKCIRPEIAAREDIQKRFIREVRICQQIMSWNVVRVHDVNQHGDELYFTMEYLRGQTLRQWLIQLQESRQQMPKEDVIRLITGICRGLEDAHRVTLHRDLKPENVFLLDSGEIKILDFGLARVLTGSGLTEHAQRMGTAYYMAPEQWIGKEVELDVRGDIYSLGVILYEMLTLYPPMGALDPLSEERDDVSDSLDDFIRRCLSKRRERRPATVSDFLKEFNQAIENAPCRKKEKSGSPEVEEINRDREGNLQQEEQKKIHDERKIVETREKAGILSDNNEFDQAQTLLQELAESFPECHEIQQDIKAIMLKRRETERVLERETRYKELSLKANELEQTGDCEGSSKIWFQLVSDYQDKPEASHSLNRLKKCIRDRDERLHAEQRRAELEERILKVRKKSETLAGEGHFDQALAKLQQLKESFPGRDDVQKDIAYVTLQKVKVEAANRENERKNQEDAIRLEEENQEKKRIDERHLTDRGESAETLEQMQQNEVVGDSAGSLEITEDSQDDLSKIYNLMKIGLDLVRIGENESAAKSFLEVLSLDPGYEAARKELDRLERRIEERKKRDDESYVEQPTKKQDARKRTTTLTIALIGALVIFVLYIGFKSNQSRKEFPYKALPSSSHTQITVIPTNTRPPVSPTQDTRKDQIAKLLIRADSYFNENSLTSPAGANAVEVSRQVLSIDNGNKGALDMIDQVAARYVTWGDGKVSTGDLSSARKHYEASLLVKEDARVRGKLDQVKSEIAKALVPTRTPIPAHSTQHSTPNTQNSISTIDLDGGITLEMVFIAGGRFQMGSPSSEKDRSDDEGPVHMVELDGFSMGKYEVTQAQYQAVMGTNPSNFKGSSRPVEQVSWKDAMEFCRKVSQRTGWTVTLPTEAQWEYAYRAGTSGPFAFGNCLSTSDANYDGKFPYSGCSEGQNLRHTWDVGSGRANAWGLYDMQGNVWEWCLDWYGSDYYGKSPRRNPVGPGSGSLRVRRGGGWGSHVKSCRAAGRGGGEPSSTYDRLGFRVVRKE